MPQNSPIPGSPEEWLARARGDLALAAAPLPEGAFYEDLCYHAQQAAEKAVKAVYRARGRGFAYTHDVAELLAGLDGEGVAIPDAVRESGVLSAFAWQTRYPGAGEPVTEAEYRRAVALAEAAVRWAVGMVERRAS